MRYLYKRHCRPFAVLRVKSVHRCYLHPTLEQFYGGGTTELLTRTFLNSIL